MTLESALASKLRAGYAAAGGADNDDLAYRRLARAKFAFDVLRELHTVSSRLFGCDEKSSLALILREAEAHFLRERAALRGGLGQEANTA